MDVLVPIPANWLTLAEAAEELALAPEEVVRLIKRGRLRARRTPYGRYIDPVAVYDYAIECRLQPTEVTPLSWTGQP